MMEMVDIGVNLTNKSLLRDLDGVLRRALDAGVRRMAVTGTSVETSQQAIDLCRRFPERLVSTCGIHPHHASEWDNNSRGALEQMASQDCVRAIGEAGLDFNRNYSPPEAQEHAFEKQLELAVELRLPLFCHQRDAHSRFVEMLRVFRRDIPRVVVHCFTGGREALDDYLGLDCYIGITGWICDERRGLDLQRLVGAIPRDRLLLETDAPYLLPRDLEPKPANRTNEPAYLPHILRAVARHRAEPELKLASQVFENSKVFFDLR